MALYFYFNETTGDLVYSDKATYDVEGYVSLGEQMSFANPSWTKWVFNFKRASIRTVTKDPATSSQIDVLTSMNYMFYNCKALTSLDLSGFDTSAVTGMCNMFGLCQALTSLDLSSFDTSSVTDMSSMFDGCKALTSLDLSGFDTSNVTFMNKMFNSCDALTSLDLSSFDTSNVTNMEKMFSYCRVLTSLDLSSFDTSNVTNMNRMFYACQALTSLDLSSFYTPNVTDMYKIFSNCQALTSLDLSGFDTSGVTNMEEMFYNCRVLTSLDLSSFDTSNVTNMEKMFADCRALTSLDLSSFDTSNVTYMTSIFPISTSLRLITISDKMSNVLSKLPVYQYYPAAGGAPVAKADLTAGTWVRDEADLTKVTSIVQQAQMSQAISRRIGDVRRDLEAQIREASALLSQLDFAAGGLIPIENGGTGATSAAAARTSLGLGALATLGSPLPVAHGGTGATTANAARNNLGLNGQTGYLKAGRGSISDISRDTLYNLAPGTYLVANDATNGPESGDYGNLLVGYITGNRIMGLLAYDNGHIYTIYGASAESGTLKWKRIDATGS